MSRVRFRGELQGFRSGKQGLDISLLAEQVMFDRCVKALDYVHTAQPITLRLMATKGGGLVIAAMLKAMLFDWHGIAFRVVVPQPGETLHSLMNMIGKPVLVDIGEAE